MADIWNKYEPTAARKRGKPGREMRPKSITVDMHSHVSVPRAHQFALPHIDFSTIPLAHFASEETKALNLKQDADIRERMAGNDERLRHLDEMGIDMQLVCPPPPQSDYTVKLDIAVPATKMLNDGIAEFIAKRPDRYVALGACRCRTATKRRKSSSVA